MRRAGVWVLLVVSLLGCGKRQGETPIGVEPAAVGQAPPQPEVAPEPAVEPDARDVVPGCPDTETRRYVADTERCAVIRYVCAEGEVYFSDGCGCGCQRSR